MILKAPARVRWLSNKFNPDAVVFCEFRFLQGFLENLLQYGFQWQMVTFRHYWMRDMEWDMGIALCRAH